MRLPQLFAADVRGQVYGHTFPRAAKESNDSTRTPVAVVRMNSFTAAQHDTLATLWFERSPAMRKTSTDSGVLRVNVNVTSLHMSEAAVVTPKGKLVVLRGDGIRIEWRDAAGRLQLVSR